MSSCQPNDGRELETFQFNAIRYESERCEESVWVCCCVCRSCWLISAFVFGTRYFFNVPPLPSEYVFLSLETEEQQQLPQLKGILTRSCIQKADYEPQETCASIC